MELPLIKRIIEAALLAASHPLTLPQLGALFDEFDMPAPDQLAKAIEALQADCAERGVELVEVASGYRYQVCEDVHAHVGKLWAEKPSRYSRALLETLALIAYRQPITRAEIESIRGVAVSTNIVRTLEERDWVRVVGHRDLPGKPALLGTTRQFLDYFKLKSLDELPPLSEIHDLEEIERQFAFDEAIPTAPLDLAAADADANADADADADDDAAPAALLSASAPDHPAEPDLEHIKEPPETAA
ncbi:SMC-Scp complex subunit ScpB [Dokdonella sp.]|uniref:SMC-Scp complex subunit ScpB n=1 Tax=Dokdonella sp. TaxID=2291710 RepID=UPI0031BCB767|nr:SMC-Scp complex subunit ScpB [Dokdonella sp.]